MLAKYRNKVILIADDGGHTRRLMVDVLKNAGFSKFVCPGPEDDLRHQIEVNVPQIVIIPGLLGSIDPFELVRDVRAGKTRVSRTLPIILYTSLMTQAMLGAARSAGVDEMLVLPFSASALLSRIEAVLQRPRAFIECKVYRGPCRRRRMLEDYGGPLRRFTDPLEDENALAPWEAESNKALVRLAVEKISKLSDTLSVSDRRKLREIYAAAKDTEDLADDLKDVQLGDSARSLGRYIVAIRADGEIDPEVVATHIDAMQKLCMLDSSAIKERQQLADGLVAVVDKRLGLLVNAAQFFEADASITTAASCPAAEQMASQAQRTLSV